MTATMPRFCSACGAGIQAGARFCGQCGAAIVATPRADPPSLSGDGERRQATVLFADLCGYTALSRRLDAEDMRALLARFFVAVDGSVRRHGGAVDKHVGDAVMAVFGAPVSHGNDAERALRAAVAMREAVATIATPDGQPLAVHIGIASGEVVAGRTGSDIHAEYTVTGEAANLAARLVEHAGPGDIVIGDALRAAAARVAPLASLGEVAIKGFAAPLTLWRLGSPLAGAAGGPPALPLIGREAERAQLVSVINAATTGAGQVVVLRGEPGIGKTRLVDEVLAVAAARGLQVLRAQVLDFGVERGRDAVAVIARALVERAPAAAGANGLALDDLLDRPRDAEGASLWNMMTPAVREQARRRALAELASEAAAPAPLLIAVEDLHWAEPSTLGGISALASAARSRPLALLMSTRIDGDPIDRTWRGNVGAVRFTTIELAPLDETAAIDLARAIQPDAGAAARSWVARAEGNPLFLIELARHADGPLGTLPETVQSVVQARIDRLAPAAKALVQCASIAGQRVESELLAELARPELVEVSPLIEAGLLRPDGTGFTFTHALVLEGVYGTLLRARRRDLHGRAAAHYAERDIALSAGHLERAEDPAAPAAYRRAAEQAFTQGRVGESLSLAERGVALAQSAADRASLGFARGEALLELGRAGEAEASFRAILDFARGAADRCHAWTGVAASQRLLSRIDDAFESLAQADAARGGEASLAAAAARTHYLRGNLHFARGEVERCRAEHEAAQALARAAGNIEYEIRALSGLGDAAYGAGRMRTALAAFERCAALCRAQGFPRIAQSCSLMIGTILRYFNEMPRSIDLVRTAIVAAERTGNRLGTMTLHLVLARCFEDLGRDDEALAAMETSYGLSRALGTLRYDSFLLMFKAGILWRRGEGPAAREATAEALSIARETGLGFYGAGVLGRVALVAEDDRVAREALVEGEAVIARGCLSHNHASFYPDAIAVSLRAGQLDEALRYTDSFAAHFAAEPLPRVDLLCRRARALVAHARGSRDAALLAELADVRAAAIDAGLASQIGEIDAALAAAAAGKRARPRLQG